MKPKKKISTDPSVRVVFANVCRKCESINGREVVRELTKQQIEHKLKSEPDFAEFKDVHHNANYRSVNWIHSCIQC